MVVEGPQVKPQQENVALGQSGAYQWVRVTLGDGRQEGMKNMYVQVCPWGMRRGQELGSGEGRGQGSHSFQGL
ncbi:hypothetical protein FKM82_030668 [Ascaphus truei]